MIGFYENGLVSSLIEMTAPMMTVVVINCISGVESLHEALEICFRGHQEKVEMVVHQNIGVNFYVVKFSVSRQNLEKGEPIPIIAEDFFLSFPRHVT
jgi:hypothetical protein